jgi:hypothetical protein
VSTPSPFSTGLQNGCLIAAGLFGLLLLIGKIAQWTQ